MSFALIDQCRDKVIVLKKEPITDEFSATLPLDILASVHSGDGMEGVLMYESFVNRFIYPHQV